MQHTHQCRGDSRALASSICLACVPCMSDNTAFLWLCSLLAEEVEPAVQAIKRVAKRLPRAARQVFHRDARLLVTTRLGL